MMVAIAILPVIVVHLPLSKFIVRGVALGGVKAQNLDQRLASETGSNFWRSGLQDARPAQGSKRMQGTARGFKRTITPSFLC